MELIFHLITHILRIFISNCGINNIFSVVLKSIWVVIDFVFHELVVRCVMMIDYYDHDCPAFIYYAEINNIIIFNDFDIALCNAYPAQSNFFETTLDRVLDILIMQDTLINDDIITLNRFVN